MPAVAVIIVNYGTAGLVIDHMPAVLSELDAFPGSTVHIVDNASPGGDAAELAAAFDGEARVEVIAAPENGGFAYGNNRGLEAIGQRTDRPLVFFLNPDARPRPGALTRMVETLLREPGAGVVGPRLVNDRGEERASAFRRSTPVQEYLAAGGVGGRLLGARAIRVETVMPGEVKETTWIPGAAMLVRPEVIERVGGMDEGYFLYFEETDWLEAVGRAGFRVLVDGGAVVEHIEGVATGVVGARARARDLPDYWYASWRRFWIKNRSHATAASAAAAFFLGLLISRLRRPRANTSGARLGTFGSKCLWPAIRGAKP